MSENQIGTFLNSHEKEYSSVGVINLLNEIVSQLVYHFHDFTFIIKTEINKIRMKEGDIMRALLT